MDGPFLNVKDNGFPYRFVFMLRSVDTSAFPYWSETDTPLESLFKDAPVFVTKTAYLSVSSVMIKPARRRWDLRSS